MFDQATQLTLVLDEWLKELAEDVEREKALKDVVADTAKEKGKATDVPEKKAKAAEKAQLAVEKKLAKVEAKLGGIELKLVKTKSLTLAQADEIVDLKVALNASKERGYNLGFADAEYSTEPIILQAWHHRFGEGWLAALQMIGVAEDSSTSIPYPTSTPLVQSQAGAANEEETLSMRELVLTINTHVEMVDLEVSRNLHVAGDGQGQTISIEQPTESAPTHHADNVV